MYNIKKSYILNLSALYLELPVILFLILWCNWYVALLGVLLISFVHFKFIRKKFQTDISIKIPYKYIILVFVILILWCIFGGQGNLYYQSSDWGARNAIFRDMIFKDIPVSYGNDTFLSYYIGHWIVPMSLGKLLSFIGFSQNLVWNISNILLLLWTSLGVILSFLLIVFYLKISHIKYMFLSLFIFILFSGLDILGVVIRNVDFSTHLEPWNVYYQFILKQHSYFGCLIKLYLLG